MFMTPGSKQKIGQSFPKGTTLLFWQASAPLGWTKVTTQNDKLLRVVSGTGGPLGGGGSNAFSSVNAQTVVGSTTLSLSQIPSHNHNTFGDNVAGGNNAFHGSGVTGAFLQTTDFQGGGGSHNHTIEMSILFIDLILASKN
jgi:hypothetical protein